MAEKRAARKAVKSVARNEQNPAASDIKALSRALKEVGKKSKKKK